MVRGRLARLEAAFVHQLHKIHTKEHEKRLFVIVTYFTDEAMALDPVLNLPHRQLNGCQEIIGLPAIQGKQLYLVNLEAPRDNDMGAYPNKKYLLNDTTDSQDLETVKWPVVVHCTWEVGFL
jgi:hypothetical protein